MITRCEWVWHERLLIEYHDKEWGVPLHDDKLLFEFLVLDAFQAGLSWSIILKKRENFRRAFSDFDPFKIAKFNESKVDRLLQDSGIIRNKLKIESTISNAKSFLDVRKEFGSFDKYIWQFVNYTTIQNRWKSIKELPAKTDKSDLMSKDLRKRGFRFVGSTICYAFMQAAGMVNDHIINCFRYKELK
jgi:DNA-3-methyladenine glycosylase I